MTLINVERIKLFSTKSPYWCLAATVAASLLIALAVALINRGNNAIPLLVLNGVGLSEAIFLVLAALTITTEYRFSTIRTTFLAAPRRTTVLAAKTVVVAVIGGITGLVCAFASFFLAKALAAAPPEPLVLAGQVWREVAGYGALFAIAGVIAVAVGALIRQSAGAISALLVWTLLVEKLILIIPNAGPRIQPWLPFQAGDAFIEPDSIGVAGLSVSLPTNGPSHLGGLLLFAGYAAVLWAAAAFVVSRRDA